MEQIDYKFIDQVLADHACDASQIIAIMQDVQAKYRYLPKDALRYIADKVGISESKIYGVELDSISGHIAQQLYQRAGVRPPVCEGVGSP